MQLKTLLTQEQKRRQVSWDVIEQDYVLSWVLFGIGAHEVLRNSLAFKGGTALKKCYFGEYRFSQDLDFSSLEGAPVGAQLESFLVEACTFAQKELGTESHADVREISRKESASSRAGGICH